MILSMRATVTIPDDLFALVDQYTERLGVSRSRLVQDALARHIRALRDQALTEQTNAQVVLLGEVRDAALERYVARAWSQELGDDEW